MFHVRYLLCDAVQTISQSGGNDGKRNTQYQLIGNLQKNLNLLDFQVECRGIIIVNRFVL